MNHLSEETRLFLKQYYPHITVNVNKISIKEPFKMVIPSDLYPLRNKPTMALFTYMNTSRIENDPLAEHAFNENTYKMGYCYTNTENMLKSFEKHGLSDFESYVGWILVDGIPIHHAWLVYKGKHVLDPAVSLVEEIVRQNEYSSIQEEREDILKLKREYETKPNSDYQTFGQVAPFVLYIGTACLPNKGRQIFNETMKQYPNHPSYVRQGMNQNGMSTVQRMYYKK